MTRTAFPILAFVSLVAVPTGSTVADTGERVATYQIELSDPVAPDEAPRVYPLVATQDEQGQPAGYSLSFETHVCVDEQCRMVHITMHWNAVGYYQRLECPPQLPLTRKKHEPFTPEDYAKLDRILKDRQSILASQPLEVLVQPMPPAENPEIDGWSGATPQTVKDAVVEDAAFTTWTMWHWANGQIVPKLQELTERRVTPDYLRRLMRSEDRREVDFALRYLQKHPGLDESLVEELFLVLERGDREHVALSLDLLEPNGGRSTATARSADRRVCSDEHQLQPDDPGLLFRAGGIACRDDGRVSRCLEGRAVFPGPLDAAFVGFEDSSSLNEWKRRWRACWTTTTFSSLGAPASTCQNRRSAIRSNGVWKHSGSSTAAGCE
jgi:hypothetical protein